MQLASRWRTTGLAVVSALAGATLATTLEPRARVEHRYLVTDPETERAVTEITADAGRLVCDWFSIRRCP